MRFTVLATFIALAAAESLSSFSDPSSSSPSLASSAASASSSASSASSASSSASSASSASSNSSSSSSSPPEDDDFASHYVAYYSQYQLGRLATFRASYSGNDSLTEVQDAVLSRLETAVATGNASEIAAVKDLCIGTFGLAGCRKLAGAEDESCDGGREQLLQRQLLHRRDMMSSRPICTCTGLREIIMSEKCFCMHRRENCRYIVGGCGFIQGLACVGRCAPGT